MSCNELITIYNYYYIINSNIISDFIDFRKEFHLILIGLHHKFTLLINNNTPFQPLTSCPYLIQIIESFIDIWVFILITFIYDDKIQRIFNLLDYSNSLFTWYFNLKTTISILDKDLIFKIMSLYCLFYLYSDSMQREKDKILFFILKTHRDKFLNFLCVLFDSLNMISNDSTTKKAMTKPIYLFFID